MSSDRIEASKIFIWAKLGDKLEERDPARLLAIVQNKPNFYLGQIANREIDAIIDLITNEGLSDKVKAQITKLNESDEIYRQIASFLHDSDDLLSIGSMAVGELDRKDGLLALFEEED